MNNTLLRDAQKHGKPIKYKGVITKDEIELSIGWLIGELNYTQVGVALEKGKILKGRKGSGTYCRLSLCLREAFKQGLVKVAI